MSKELEQIEDLNLDLDLDLDIIVQSISHFVSVISQLTSNENTCTRTVVSVLARISVTESIDRRYNIISKLKSIK